MINLSERYDLHFRLDFNMASLFENGIYIEKAFFSSFRCCN